MSATYQLITLTTDFGHKGPFVGVMKGVIHSRLPGACIVDLSHEIHAHWPVEAGFWLAKSYNYFPAGSVHVAVVDPGVGTERDIVVVETDGHIFIAPDNGLLQALASRKDRKIYRLTEDWLHAQGWPPRSSTFHGRDIFAPLAAELAAGNVRPDEVGPDTDDLTPCTVEPAYRQGDTIHGCIIAIDHFGNLITNIESEMVQELRLPIVQVAGRTLGIHKTYGDCDPGELLSLINSVNVVEISRSNGRAEDTLGLGRGAPVSVVETARGG